MGMPNSFFDEGTIALFVQDRIQELVPVLHPTSRGWNFRCPICGDSKKSLRKARGQYYKDSNSYYCFNDPCLESIYGLNIIARFECKSIEDVKRDYIEYCKKMGLLKKDAIMSRKPTEKKEIKSKVLKEFNIPNTWVDLPPEIKSILTKRKIFDAPYFPRNYKFYYENFKKKIIIPWIKHGKIETYQERALDNNSPMKYWFPPDLPKGIFNLELVDEYYPYVFLIEGVFDCIWCKNGVATGGINLSEYQLNLLDKYMCTKVYFLDNQWEDPAGMDKSIKILKADKSNKVFIWPKDIKQKDLNDCAIYEPNFINNINSIDYLKTRIFSGARGLLELMHR